MKDIKITKNYLRGLLDYINEALEAVDVENEEIIASLNEGYDSLVKPLVELLNKEDEPEEKSYVVCIDESYIRDAQYFDSESLSDEEFEEGGNGLDAENCWCDFGPNAFVDIVTAKSCDEACQKAADKWGYDSRTMYAVEVQANNSDTTIQSFREQLECIYDIDISDLSDEKIEEIYNDVQDTLACDDTYSEIYNDAVWKALKDYGIKN